MKRLAGKTSVVTGGGSGVGRAIALEFAAQGSNVAVADRDAPAAAETVAMIDARGGAGIAVLVNNAGARCIKGFLEHTEDDWHRMIDINLTGHFLCAQAALPSMLEQGKGKIICVAS